MRYQVMLATMALGVAMSVGHAAADGPDAGYGAGKWARSASSIAPSI
jgi:hypothetical protein